MAWPTPPLLAQRPRSGSGQQRDNAAGVFSHKPRWNAECQMPRFATGRQDQSRGQYCACVPVVPDASTAVATAADILLEATSGEVSLS